MFNFNSLIISVGILLLTVSVVLGFTTTSPENILLGEWSEDSWTYEKADSPSMFYYDLSSVRKHEAEHWLFQDDNTVLFLKEGKMIGKASWIIKGRGHILRLTHEDGLIERYDIKELNHHELVLNFDIGMESRGIAKLTFTK
ncbi:hypothetical protein [Anditalea andensis]|uniref:Lipocalin-like domain-containing protein n=1 Tax=Anditalea andensis TaxID=1048983 RepID=A0A074L277_9BACT|nr:hypothetical protein [Anditalea andensis]KEO73973.1 hypothetical protein EL17_07410 [Anditalea andensis]